MTIYMCVVKENMQKHAELEKTNKYIIAICVTVCHNHLWTLSQTCRSSKPTCAIGILMLSVTIPKILAFWFWQPYCYFQMDVNQCQIYLSSPCSKTLFLPPEWQSQ